MWEAGACANASASDDALGVDDVADGGVGAGAGAENAPKLNQP